MEIDFIITPTGISQQPEDIAQALTVIAQAEPTSQRRPWADHEIVEGAPATHYVGTDSYASVVVKVERYKTGPKAGLVKAVYSCPAEVGEDGNLVPRPSTRWEVADSGKPFRTPDYDRFLRTERRGVARYCARSEGRIAFWNQLVVGYAEDYRDPHF